MTNDHKRYGWFRVYDGVGSHPVWMRAASVVGCSVADTLAVGLWLMTIGSKGRPRGNLADFDEEACAAVLRIPVERVTAIYAALQGGKKPWIDRDRIVDWDERQPHSDFGAAERMDRYRQRQKGTAQALRAVTRPLRDVTVTSPLRNATSPAVTVTDRDSDSDIITSSTLVLGQTENPVELSPPEESKGTGEGNPEATPVAEAPQKPTPSHKPPHMVGRDELEALMVQRRADRQAKLKAKAEELKKAYGIAVEVPKE